MNTNNDDNLIDDMREPSICIPKIHARFTREKIKQIFEYLKIGEIAQVDLIKNNNDKLNYRAFVHFKKWNTHYNDVRSKLIGGDNVKIVYEFPWFWKCFKSKFPRPNYLQ